VTDQDDVDRLHRQIRAMGIVNQQLRAQLEAANHELTPHRDRARSPFEDPENPPPVGQAVRRAAIAAEWIDARPHRPANAVDQLVLSAEGDTFLIEGEVRRRVRSGLLVAALERLLGARAAVTAADLAAWTEGPPVEVLEAGPGLPFVVVGGRRLPVTGIPLPHPVAEDAVAALLLGPELDLAQMTVRRDREADAWIDLLVDRDVDADLAPFVARADDGSWFVVDGELLREIRSAMVLDALLELLGPSCPLPVSQAAALTDGPPVELVESDLGSPFFVLGARRYPVRGFPLPYPAAPRSADRLRPGPTIDVSASFSRQRRDAAAARAREANPDPVAELRALVERSGGSVPAARALARKGLRRFRS